MVIRPPLQQEVKSVGTWGRWFTDVYRAITGLEARPKYEWVSVTLLADELDSGVKPVIKTADTSTARYKVRELYLVADGTNFDGSGDKNLAIVGSDELIEFTTITAAMLKSQSTARWGDTGVPYPADAEDLDLATTAGTNIKAQYSGGSTGYSFTGTLHLVILLEKTVD